MEKRFFYELAVDEEAESIMGCNFVDMKGFDWHRLRKAKLIRDWPDDVTAPILFATTKAATRASEKLRDIVSASSINNYLISHRAEAALDACRLQDVQFLPIKVINQLTRAFLGLYHVVNPLQILQGLDYEHTRWKKGSDSKTISAISKPALRLDIVSNVDFFFLQVGDKIYGDLLVSERVKRCLQDASAADGIAFLPLLAY